MANTSVVCVTGASVYMGASTPGTLVADVTHFTLNRKNDVQESTTFQSGGWKEFLAGLNSYDGTIDLNFSTKVAFNLFAGQSVGYIKLTGVGTEAYTGACIFSSVQVTDVVGNVVKATANYQCTGALT